MLPFTAPSTDRRGRLTPPGGLSLHPFAPSPIASARRRHRSHLSVSGLRPSPPTAPPRAAARCPTRRTARRSPPTLPPSRGRTRTRTAARRPNRSPGRQYTGTFHQTAAGSSAPPGSPNNTTINYYRKIICGRGRMVKDRRRKRGDEGERRGAADTKLHNCNSCIIVVLLLL